MDCYCDYESPEFHVVREIKKARKEHKCCECHRTIRIGEPYNATSGKWDGDFGTFETCQHCMELRKFVESNVPCFCWAYGNVIDDAIETARGYHEPGNGLLFGAYRRKIAIDRARKGNWQ